MSGAGRLGEFELIARIFAPLAGQGGLGLLDDAAVISPPPGHDLVVTKDMLAAGVHFFADDPWDSIARKALRVNLSDLAAKGARPLGYLLGLGLPADWTNEQLEAFGRGLGEDQKTFGIELLGGDTIKSPGGLTISITAFGMVPSGRMVRRGGAQVGDLVLVSGTIGDSALGLQLRLDPDLAGRSGISADDEQFLLGRYLHPEPRTVIAAVICDHAHAAMDLSDGLIGDLAKMAAVSGVAIQIDEATIPLSPAARALINWNADLFRTAITGGDDYEIAIALPAEAVPTVKAAADRVGVSFTIIGAVTEGLGIGGRDIAMDWEKGSSYSHF